jgi:phosphoglycerate dehydrogenase-like enzyme
MTRILVLNSQTDDIRVRYDGFFRDTFPQLDTGLYRHASEIEPLIPDADVLMTFGPVMGKNADALIARATKLKWIQALGTGVDNIADLPSLRPEVIVTNMHGIHGAPMSESAIMLMLALSRKLPQFIRAQDRHVWQRRSATVLEGKTVGVYGVGAIAGTLAPKLKALGLTVVGISGTPRPASGFDRMVARKDLEQIVGSLDYLIVLTPYSPESRGTVSAAVIQAMKPGSYLINIARGGIVDEDALLAAIDSGHLAGAAFDAFATEPLPADHPLWSRENVIVTPHNAAANDFYHLKAFPIIEHNIRCYLAGEPDRMINRVAR